MFVLTSKASKRVQRSLAIKCYTYFKVVEKIILGNYFQGKKTRAYAVTEIHAIGYKIEVILIFQITSILFSRYFMNT